MLITAALCIVGGWLVILGFQRWQEHTAVKRVAETCVVAIQNHDYHTLLKYVTEDRREEVAAKYRAMDTSHISDRQSLKPLEFTYKIHRIELDGSEAEAEVHFQKEGYVIKPLMKFNRNQDGQWELREIDRLKLDPRWRGDQPKPHDRLNNDEALARELEAKLGASADDANGPSNDSTSAP